jgi:hypothetical protein
MNTASPVSQESTASALVVSPEGDALPLRAAARAAGVSESTLRRLVQDGAVEAVRDGGSLKVTQATVVELRAGGALKRGPSISVREAERARGALAARCFLLFQAAVPLEDVVTQLEADPDVVVALHQKWIAMRERTALWLSRPPPAAPLPQYDHPAAEDGECCPGHMAAKRMKESK